MRTGKILSVSNTEFTEWFERDRANVRLDDKATGETLIDMWDEEVQSFVEDGFYDRRKGWHQSLVDYVNSWTRVG